MNGKVVALFICPKAKAPMQKVKGVEALFGTGLKGDRYAAGAGSYNKGKQGKRQVTLMNARFFKGSGYTHAESRRNIIVENVDLMWLIGRQFKIGEVTFVGVKYCDPCEVPKALAKKKKSFSEAFLDCGGLIAEVFEGGLIKVGDAVIPPSKGY